MKRNQDAQANIPLGPPIFFILVPRILEVTALGYLWGWKAACFAVVVVTFNVGWDSFVKNQTGWQP